MADLSWEWRCANVRATCVVSGALDVGDGAKQASVFGDFRGHSDPYVRSGFSTTRTCRLDDSVPPWQYPKDRLGAAVPLVWLVDDHVD